MESWPSGEMMKPILDKLTTGSCEYCSSDLIEIEPKRMKHPIIKNKHGYVTFSSGPLLDKNAPPLDLNDVAEMLDGIEFALGAIQLMAWNYMIPDALNRIQVFGSSPRFEEWKPPEGFDHYTMKRDAETGLVELKREDHQ